MLWEASLSPSLPTTLSVQKNMINQKIINFANAIALYEGWAPLHHPLAKDGGPTIAYRNHNPGNLRYSIFQVGTRFNFSVFQNDSVGFFAMCYDIMYKAQNKSRYIDANKDTIKDFIRVWSNTKGIALEKYVKFVCDRTGFFPQMLVKDLLR